MKVQSERMLGARILIVWVFNRGAICGADQVKIEQVLFTGNGWRAKVRYIWTLVGKAGVVDEHYVLKSKMGSQIAEELYQVFS